MRLCNNPTRRLQRRISALARYPAQAKTAHIQGTDWQERVAVVAARWVAERARLIELCATDENETRRIKTKKDHSARAKLRFGAEQQ
jgi:hypothetical protein